MERLKHTKRIAELLRAGRLEQAVELHNAWVKQEMEKAQRGVTIDLSDLMAAKETLQQHI